MVPLRALTKFTPHEQQFLARVGEHECVKQPQVGKFAPFVPRHFAQQGLFAMHYLVMGEGQDEIFGEGIKQAEGQLVMMVMAVDGVFAHVLQSVMHPTHVPLHRKAQSASPSRTGHLRPRG